VRDGFVKVVELVVIDGIRVRQDITELLPSFSWQLAEQPSLDSSSVPLGPDSKSSSNSLGSRVLAYLRRAMKCPECLHLATETATVEAVVDCLHLIPILGYSATSFLV